MSSAQASNSASTVQEYVIRVPKNNTKKHHVMRFNSVLNVDFSKWNQVKMERENNMKEYRGLDDEMPKYGAGSEFGRDQREEARRKKFGIVTKKYRPEDQPWILKVGGKTGKKFKGIREGGVGENAAYYVFTHAPDGAIEAFPLREWYNFQPIQRYKALSAEEAEQEFGRRNKVMNYFSLMLRKRLRNDEDGDIEELEEGRKGPGGKGGKGKGELKISDMDEWVDSDNGEDNSDDEEADKEKEDDESKDKKGKGKKGADKKGKSKKKRRDSNDEAFEESDDGDEEGREVDYISDSSDSELDQEENVKDSMKGVAEEDALRKLLTSDEEDEEEREGGEDEDGDEDKADGEKGDDGDDAKKGGVLDSDADDKKGASSSKKKKPKGGKKDTIKKKDPSSILNDSSSNSSSDSSDSESKKKPSKGKETNSGNSSRAATPTKNSLADAPISSASSSSSSAGADSNKRKGDPDSVSGGSAKKPRIDSILSTISSDSGITEEAVRRYLMRKPMTATELLQKFKSKKTGLSSEQLVNVMTQILKRINPIKQTIKGKMYLSIKA